MGLAAAVFVCLFIQDMGFPCYGSIYRHAAACIGSYTVFLKFKNCISQLLQDVFPILQEHLVACCCLHLLITKVLQSNKVAEGLILVEE